MSPRQLLDADAERLRALADTLDADGDTALADAARRAADQMDLDLMDRAEREPVDHKTSDR